MTPFAIRLESLLKEKKADIASLSKSFGYDSPEKIYRLIRKPKEGEPEKLPSFTILADLANMFDDLNMTWLLTGEGEMLLPDSKQSGKREGDHLITDEGVFVAEDQVAVYSSKIELLENQIRIKDEQIIDYLETMKLLRSQIQEYKKKHEDCIDENNDKSKQRSA